jgi:hypothetical protein
METGNGRPPFKDLQEIIGLTGYEVISIEAEHTGRRFTGTINIQIAPTKWIEQTDYISFPQIPQDFVVKCREYAKPCQSPPGYGPDEAASPLSMDGISDAFKG